ALMFEHADGEPGPTRQRRQAGHLLPAAPGTGEIGLPAQIASGDVAEAEIDDGKGKRAHAAASPRLMPDVVRRRTGFPGRIPAVPENLPARPVAGTAPVSPRAATAAARRGPVRTTCAVPDAPPAEGPVPDTTGTRALMPVAARS